MGLGVVVEVVVVVVDDDDDAGTVVDNDEDVAVVVDGCATGLVDFVVLAWVALDDDISESLDVDGSFFTVFSPPSSSSEASFLDRFLGCSGKGLSLLEDRLLLRLVTVGVMNWISALGSIVQNAPFPGSASPLGTLTNALFNDRLCRIEFYARMSIGIERHGSSFSFTCHPFCAI